MDGSIDWQNDIFPEHLTLPQLVIQTLQTPALPQHHPAEADLFARHEGIPGHRQEALVHARILLAGAGGLNSWTALGLARSGAQALTIVDPDVTDRTNLSRQLYFADDLGQPKVFSLAHNLVPHAVAGAEITAIFMRMEQALEEFALPADLLVVGVDNNACRLACVRAARQRRIPAVFTMLSRDGMRCHTFLQGPDPGDACLWCALPNLDPESASPCAAAIISSCLFVAGMAIFFAHRALMGWPVDVEPFNWREADLIGQSSDRIGNIVRRADCKICRDL